MRHPTTRACTASSGGERTDEVAAGDRVRVRYVGYRLGDEIVAKAEVTRV